MGRAASTRPAPICPVWSRRRIWRPGDVLTPSLVMAAPALPEGWREVGAVVRPGRFPSTVAVGDELVAVPIDDARRGVGDGGVVVGR